MARMVGASGEPRTSALGTVVSRRLPLILAVAFGLLAAMGINAYLQGLRRAEQPGQLVTVVVARTDIRERAVIAANQIEERQFPAAYAHPSAITALTGATGRVAVSDIAAGEQILSSKVSVRGARTGLSYIIPPGKRAITIAVGEVKGVGGFIAPGDMVDVIVTFQSGDTTVTRTLFQRIQVLATAQKVEEQPGQPPQIVSSVTLAVTPQEAERLILADEEGRVRFSLRPAGESTVVHTSGALPRKLIPELAAAEPVVLSSSPAAPPAGPTVAEVLHTLLGPPLPPSTVPASAPAPPAPLPLPAQPAPVAYQLPAGMRLQGVFFSNDGQQVAIVLLDGLTFIVAPGDVLVDGLTVESIGDGGILLRRGEGTHELSF